MSKYRRYQGKLATGLLRFYDSICGSVSVRFLTENRGFGFSRFRFLREIWVKQTINCKRNNVIREPRQLRPI